MKKIIAPIIAVLVLWCAVFSHAQVDVLTNMDQANIPTLNDNLKTLDSAARKVRSYFTDGILNASSGGTGQDSSAWTSGDFVYMSSTGVWGHTVGIPSGVIVMWHGSIASIPTGWLLCDGSNGTIDLRNRFIVGADADVIGVAKSTITGAALQTSEGQLPSTLASTGTYIVGIAGGFSDGIQAASANDHSIQITSAFGTGTANVAKFYALAYIMKS